MRQENPEKAMMPNSLMSSTEIVKGEQFVLMLDKAIKHGKLMNHWLDRARELMKK